MKKIKHYWLMRFADGKVLYRQLASTLNLANGESVFVNGEEFCVA